MVEITAINHKLLFEITALISPSGGRRETRGLCKVGGEDGAMMGSPRLGDGLRVPE